MTATQLALAPSVAAFHEWNGVGEVLEHLNDCTYEYLCPECRTPMVETRSPVSGRTFPTCPRCGCRVRWSQIDGLDETLDDARAAERAARLQRP